MVTLAAWFNDLNPVIVRITDGLAVKWYGVSYLLGFIAAIVIMTRMARRGTFRIVPERVGDAWVWLIAGTLIGGRLGYCVFYDPRLLVSFTESAPFWGVLAINKGGMASHGGMIGLTLACWRISRGWKEDGFDASGARRGRTSVLHVMDVAALVAPIGVFFGRIANFVNGELLGKIVTPPGVPGPWWSVQFPHELDLPADKAPKLTLEQQDQLLALARQAAPGKPVDVGIAELAARPWRYAEQLKPLIASRHPSQLYQAAAEGLVLGAILWLVWSRKKLDGMVVAAFFIAYGVLRIVTEFWRLPDAHLKSGYILGLSRGQWLSVAMVVVGAALVGVIRARGRRGAGGATPPTTGRPSPSSS